MDMPDPEVPPSPQRRRSTSTDPEATIDLLKDPRFRKSNEWFGDASFASKPYPYGGMTGKPSHCPDPKHIEKSVIRSVQESEACESSDEEEDDVDDEEKQTKSSTKEYSVTSIIRRMATKPSMVAIRFLGWALSKVWRAAFTSVHVHNSEVATEAVNRSKARPGTALIILPTHRSHADYLLMSYIFFGLNLPVPVIAAGDNLNVPLLGRLLARAGAFFIRRSASTPRYKLVLQAYMYELARSGVPVEFFIEGGRSRRGNVGRPKVGLLSMIIQMVRDGDLQDALLLPVSLDYDSVPEGNGFAQEVLGTAKKKPESLFGTIKAAIDWMLWGKRGGGVYVGFGDRILSVKELMSKFSKLSNLGMSSSTLALSRTSSPFDPSLFTASARKRLSNNKEDGSGGEKEEKVRLLASSGGSHHQLHHHHDVPPPGAIFRGGSGTSLATSLGGGDDMMGILAQDIGRTVVEHQRDASLISVGGIAACAMLMGPPDNVDTLDEIKRRASLLVQLLVELGHGHRIPDGTLTAFTIHDDIERTVTETFAGGPTMARSGGAKARVCLRYAAAPVIVRLLPVFVVALKQRVHSEFHSWLAGMFDVELRLSYLNGQQREEEEEEALEEDLVVFNNGLRNPSSSLLSLKRFHQEEEDDRARELEERIPTDLVIEDAAFRKELVELIAPAVMILNAALSLVSHWRMDTIVSEADAVNQVREMLANAPFPELSAPLEIAAAFKACVIHKVLKRATLDAPLLATTTATGTRKKSSSAPKKVCGYELEPTFAPPLAKGRSALLDAKAQLDKILNK